MAAPAAPETPRDVLLRYLEGVAAQQWDALPELYAVTAVVRHPFATDDSQPLVGREQLRDHFAQLGRRRLKMQARDVIVHETANPEVIVAEFTYHGHSASDGNAFERPAVFVLTVRNGQIIESRDYLGPLQPSR